MIDLPGGLQQGQPCPHDPWGPSKCPVSSHLSYFAPHFTAGGNQGRDVPMTGDTRFWVNPQHQENKPSPKLLPVGIQPEVSTWKPSSKQTTRSSRSWPLAGAWGDSAWECYPDGFPSCCFEGKCLFYEDCKSWNSRMLASPYVYRINRIQTSTNVRPCSLRNRLFASCGIN